LRYDYGNEQNPIEEDKQRQAAQHAAKAFARECPQEAGAFHASLVTSCDGNERCNGYSARYLQDRQCAGNRGFAQTVIDTQYATQRLAVSIGHVDAQLLYQSRGTQSAQVAQEHARARKKTSARGIRTQALKKRPENDRARPRRNETARIASCHFSRTIKVAAGRPDAAATAGSAAADRIADPVAAAPAIFPVGHAAGVTGSIDWA